MTLGANQIAAYAADIFDTEDQIDALQNGKRDLYKAIREEHGKAEANALKLAVKLSRMKPEKISEAEAIDTEAQRMLAIIEKAGRAPRAARVENIEQIGADESADQSTAARKDVLTNRFGRAGSTPASSTTAGDMGESAVRPPAGTQAPPVDTHFEIAPPAQTGKPTPLAGVGGDEDRPPNSKQWGFKDKPHHDCLNPTQCGGFSNLGLCEPCKQAAA